MKTLLLAGGILGLALGAGVSALQGSSIPVCFWHGCLAAYITALLARWWGRTWRANLQQTLLEKEKAEEAAPPPAPPSPMAPKTSKT